MLQKTTLLSRPPGVFKRVKLNCKMRIGIVCPNFPPANFEGGIAHYSDILALLLSKRGHEVIVIRSSDFAQDLQYAQIIRKIKMHQIEGPWNWKSVFEIRKFLVTNRPA